MVVKPALALELLEAVHAYDVLRTADEVDLQIHVGLKTAITGNTVVVEPAFRG
jgi:hypothetical protein